jgi:colanic acid biosynthesis glycosyl transferase WcaI
VTVLILSPLFFPEVISTGKYNKVLAQTLAEGGNDVVVFSSHPFYPEWRPKRTDEELPGIIVKRGGAWMRYPNSAALRRAMLELWFAAFCFKEYIRLNPKPCHIVAVFPPTVFMPLLKLILARGSIVTGIVHDLQSVHVAQSNSLQSRIVNAIVSWIERKSYLACDRIVFLSQSMADRAIRQYGLDAARCFVCYPFPTTTDRGAATTCALVDVLASDHINIVYSGALGEKQCPDELVGLMTKLARRQDHIRCHIFSAGPHFERLKRRYLRDSNSTVAFRDFVPDEELPELYARSAIQLIPQASGTSEGSLPSKLPNLLYAGVPVLAICDDGSEVGLFLKKTKGGYSAQSFSEDEVFIKFDALLAEVEFEPRVARMDRLRPLVDAIFSIDTLMDLILKPI